MSDKFETSSLCQVFVHKVSNKLVRIPDEATIRRDLSPLWHGGIHTEQHFEPTLLTMAGTQHEYGGIVIHWTAAAYAMLESLNSPVMQRMFAAGMSDYNITKAKFLCFCIDKEEGSAAWDEYALELSS